MSDLMFERKRRHQIVYKRTKKPRRGILGNRPLCEECYTACIPKIQADGAILCARCERKKGED